MKILIAGNGQSGCSVADYCDRNKILYEFAKDEDVNIGENLKDEKYVDRLFFGLSFIVKSPGIRFDSPLLVFAKKRKVKVVGELEFGASKLAGDIIAITGTNGKTTTVSIVKHFLQNLNQNVFLGGNIGTPVSSFCDKTDDSSISILECSSFQLEKISNFKPHIAAILNITPDHLNFHKSMKDYIKAKLNIAKGLTKNDYLLLNADDEILMKNKPKTNATIYYFSVKKRVIGCFVKNDSIYFNDGVNENRLVSIKNIKLVGEHNKSNILCAVLAVYLETGKLFLLENISSFQGVSHRIEYVNTIRGVTYYNDSKSTNIDSTFVAIKSFKGKVHLLLGGSDKGYGFDNFFELLPKNVGYIACFGETSSKILKSANEYKFCQIMQAKTLKEAVFILKNVAKFGETILLSPACASFDQFKNYEERGNVFKKIVQEIFDNENINEREKQDKKL